MKISTQATELRVHVLVKALLAVSVAMFAGQAQSAALEFIPFGSGQYLYNSNVYRFSSQVADVTNTTETADNLQRYTAGLNTNYAYNLWKLQSTVEGRVVRFDEFTDLDHEELALGASLSGKLLNNTTGLLSFSHERRMASFEDRRSTELSIERDQIVRGQLRYAVTPDWSVIAGGRYRDLRSPLPAAPALPQPAPGAPARLASPDFAVEETTYSIGVQYGIEKELAQENEIPILIGILLEEQSVDFNGFNAQPPPAVGEPFESFDSYKLQTLQATVDYAVSGLTRLDAKLGVSQYKTAQDDSASLELTGEIGYERDLSAVTEVNAHLFRRVAPYVATADNTTDTGASVGIRWEPIVDLSFLADYAWASSSFRSISGLAAENSGRGDTTKSANLSVAYALVDYFTIKLFGIYNERASNLDFNDYSEEIVGIELSVRLKP
ncbi:MAG: hypothetical protein M3O62_10525 [Pseudomonadota bacterium]|nr:hypothetical protein [Pseudomonadota bacterium]